MRATVTKVSGEKTGRYGEPYRLVFFKIEGGGSALTYISERMKNYDEWKHNLEVGAVLEDLRFRKDGKTIDADSHPRRVDVGAHQQQLF